MPEHDMEARLQVLEKKCQRLRNGLIALLLAPVAVVLMGQATTSVPERIVARSFVVVDEDGKERIGISGQKIVMVGDQPSISLLNTESKHTMLMRAGPDRSVITLEEEKGASISLKVREAGSTVILSHLNSIRAALSSQQGPLVGLSIFGADETNRISVVHDGRKDISWVRVEGNSSKATLTVTDDDRSAQLNLGGDGGGSVAISDKDGNIRAIMTNAPEDEPESLLALTDAAGKVVWKAP